MADQIERIADLILKDMNGSLTPEESVELEAWKAASPENLQRFYDRINQTELLENVVHYQNAEDDKEEMKSRIPWESVIRKSTNSNHPISWRKLSVAASILVVLSISAFFWIGRSKKAALEIKDNNRVISKNDIPAPTGTRTILTLGNGAQVVLDSVQNGTLARQGSVSVSKLNGQLIYNTVLHEKSSEIMYNTLSTAKGGQTMIVLADGSKVWLNAASSIRFPAVFVGKEREVEMTGEVYFEVAHNVKQPFRVKVGDQIIEDIGTQFNINAYEDETAVKTTLIEGSVRVNLKGDKVTLKPGQQAEVASSGANKENLIKIRKEVDVAEVVAWKNGYFYFTESDLLVVMRQFAKWYDVQVDFKGTIPSQKFSGKIQRNLSLSKVLKGLENDEVHFTVDGKKVIVTP